MQNIVYFYPTTAAAAKRVPFLKLINIRAMHAIPETVHGIPWKSLSSVKTKTKNSFLEDTYKMREEKFWNKSTFYLYVLYCIFE